MRCKIVAGMAFPPGKTLGMVRTAKRSCRRRFRTTIAIIRKDQRPGGGGQGWVGGRARHQDGQVEGAGSRDLRKGRRRRQCRQCLSGVECRHLQSFLRCGRRELHPVRDIGGMYVGRHLRHYRWGGRTRTRAGRANEDVSGDNDRGGVPVVAALPVRRLWKNDEAADNRRRCRPCRPKILCGHLVRINDGHVNVEHAPPMHCPFQRAHWPLIGKTSPFQPMDVGRLSRPPLPYQCPCVRRCPT
jgi:hypothetical protein